MAVLKRTAACAALLLGACERPAEPVSYAEPAAAVHAVVAAGASGIGVYVTRFTPGSERPSPVSGAQVTLTRGAAALAAVERPGSGAACFGARAAGDPAADAGCYAAAVPGGVRSGDAWRLEVRFPTGETAAGELVVPQVPALVEPAEGARVPVRNFGVETLAPGGGSLVPLATLRVRWEAPPGQPRTDLGLRALRVFAGGRVLDGAACGLLYGPGPETDLGEARDVSVTVFRAECRDPASASPQPLQWDSVHVALAVTHYDSAYARYVREVAGSEAVARGHAAAGLHGALGLFAGAAPAQRTITFVPQP